MAHRSADIRNGGANLLKYRRPRRIRNLTDKYVAVAQAADPSDDPLPDGGQVLMTGPRSYRAYNPARARS